MNSALKTTFDLLAKTENEAAVGVLLPALDASNTLVREAALRAILDRRSLVGQREIVRRMHEIDDSWRAIIDERRGRMTQALRDAVLDPDPRMCANGCRAILWFHEYDLIPTLVNATEDTAHPNTLPAGATLVDLASELYEELSSPRDYRNRRDPQLVRRNVTTSLEESVKRYNKHKRLEPIEAFLILAARDNATLMQIVSDPRHPSYVPIIQTLTHSPRLGVMRLVLGYLDDPQAPHAMISVLAHRTDRRFVDNLLRKIGHEPSAAARANLRHVDSIAWLKGPTPLLEELDDAGQHSTVQLLAASGVKPALAYPLIEHLARHGKVGGRRSAVAALATFQGADANNLALAALRDADPQVQAYALAQLRPRGLPGALSILLGNVDSPHHVVRQAARDALREFNFRRFLGSFDVLEDDVRRSTGLLVKRIDVNTLPLLRLELKNSACKRRLRGLVVARAIAAVPQLEDVVIELLTSDEHTVRAEAAAALGDSDSHAARAALRDAADDDNSFPVREAAMLALQQIEYRAANPTSEEPVAPLVDPGGFPHGL